MTGQRYHLHNLEQLQNFTEEIKRQWIAGKKPTVQFLGEARTTDQNGMLYELYREIAQQKGDETEVEIKRYVKLHLGVPILRAADSQFREDYDLVIKPLDYERKLIAMDWWPVTSKMNKEQFARLIDQTIIHFQQQGIEISARGN